jgi:uncharacterized protein YijF (DUF1287 family)
MTTMKTNTPMITYSVITDAGDESDVRARSLESAVRQVRRRLGRRALADGAYAILRFPEGDIAARIGAGPR